jgi:hypothetical protein
MCILVPEVTDCYGLSGLPLVDRRLGSLLLFPFAVDQKSSVGVGLLPYAQLFLKNAVIFAFWVLRMVDPGETVRMTGFNQPVHPFFLESVDRLEKLRLILASQRISVLELYGITFKFELLIRTASQLQGSSADHSFFLATELTAFEEI